MGEPVSRKRRSRGGATPEDDHTLDKSEFFLAASHQLKAPLAIIEWCLHSAIESGSLSPKTTAYITQALTQVSGMQVLVTDMLHVFSLLRHADRASTYTRVNLNELITCVISQYTMVAEQRHVRLQTGVVETLPKLSANEAFLRQALVNLVDNAIKYTAPGKTVTVSAQQVDQHIEIAVADEGIGIAPADHGRLFTEFFRSHEAKEVAHEGTGLGLVVVKHVVEDLGGTVRVKSALGQGSTFTLHLPLS